MCRYLLFAPSDRLSTSLHSALTPRRLFWVDFSNRLLCALASLGLGQQGTPAGEQKQGMRAGNFFQTEGLSVSLKRKSLFSKVARYTWFLSFLIPDSSPYSGVSGPGYDSPGGCPLQFPPCVHLYSSINLIYKPFLNYSNLNAPSVLCWHSDTGPLNSRFKCTIISKHRIIKEYKPQNANTSVRDNQYLLFGYNVPSTVLMFSYIISLTSHHIFKFPGCCLLSQRQQAKDPGFKS